MSVNYYAVTPDTPEGDEGLHIGQHAGGWEFLFRAHPDLGLVSSEAWREYLSRPDVKILAESGYEVPVEEFMADATLRPAEARAKGQRMRVRPRPSWADDKGCPFADNEFC
ncbi:hypothetical protein [Nonomuraea indica]|uniref:hypothetical protein n=1 Tax=Nonomuraea indica TaxID=1581193 RepID=UPI000C7A68CD|nr:hypothetical protein [Nonomuraea indica]